MVVFEMTSKEVSKVLIANYTENDERLFQVNLAEAEIISEDMLVNVLSFTTIKRHTNAGFIVKHFHAGDQVILTRKGDWKVTYSLRSCYMMAVGNQLVLYKDELVCWLESFKTEELGTIKRKIQQNFCCYIESR